MLSGKGGVGKSTFSAQLAFSLAEQGKEARTASEASKAPQHMICICLNPPPPHPQTQVGLLDIDICGPSAPKMTGLEGEEIRQSGSGWSPVYVQPNLAVMSIGFLLTDPNDAVVWRGPRKSGLIKQFLKDVDWGSLDYLVRALLLLAPPPCHAPLLLTRSPNLHADRRRAAGHLRRAHLYRPVPRRVATPRG